MADVLKLDFKQYVDDRVSALPVGPGNSGPSYAYITDRNTRSVFETAKPVEHAVEAAVRIFKAVTKGDLLGRAVKVGPTQFPRVHRLTQRCAETLGIPAPSVFVVNSPVMNAMTLGTNDDSIIMVHSALIDHFSDEELLSVIGHECGHIHNRHVVYLTALHYVTQLASLVLKGVLLPARVALLGYQRRAEITCDRAGLLCCKDLAVSTRALTKLALGSSKLYEQLNMQAFVDQFEEAKGSVGTLGELGASHPHLPKRVLALRHFAESQLYRKHAGLGTDGIGLEEVDEKVHGIIKIVG